MDLYEIKPNCIKSFGVRILPVLESANINFKNIDKTFTPNVPAWCINKPKLIFGLHSGKKSETSPIIKKKRKTELKNNKKKKENSNGKKNKHRKKKNKQKKQNKLKRILILCLLKKMMRRCVWKRSLWYSQTLLRVTISLKAHCQDYQ